LRFTQTDAGDLGPVQLVFLSRDPNEHHQLVLATGRPANMAFNVVNQISFRVPDLAALRRHHDRLLAEGATDMLPVTHGNAVSVYCRDPEGNRLELFMDTPWYCDQPLREPIDLNQSDEAILAQAQAIAQRFPKYKSRAEWQAEVARKMQEDQHG
jgi:catechol 2,3-dioxygenase